MALLRMLIYKFFLVPLARCNTVSFHPSLDMDLSYYSLISILLVFILPVFLTLIFRKNDQLPPGSFGLPLIGETLDFVMPSRSERFITERMERYSPKVFKTSLLGHKMAVFCGPSGNKFVFHNHNKLFKAWVPASVDRLFAPEGMDVPALMSEFLKRGALQNYIDVMNFNVIQHLENECSRKETLKAFPLVKKVSLYTNFQLFLGIEEPRRIDRLVDQFSVMSSGVFSFPINFPGTAFNRALTAAKFIRSEIRKYVKDEKEKKTSEAHYLLSHLVRATDAAGKFLSESNIECVILAAVFASVDSTASAITSLLYYLADYPGTYEQVLKEQLEISKAKGPKEFLTWEDTQKMKYSRNAVNEVLRISPPASGTFREALHDITYEGYTIPKGWKIFWSNASTNRDPKYFPNPTTFNPARFEDGLVPFTFLPFAAGPTMCPGSDFARQFILVFLHNFILKYKWEKLDPREKIIFGPQILHPNGLPIKVRPRIDQATSEE